MKFKKNHDVIPVVDRPNPSLCYAPLDRNSMFKRAIVCDCDQVFCLRIKVKQMTYQDFLIKGDMFNE